MGTEPLVVASGSRIQLAVPGKKQIHDPGSIELLARLLPQAVL